jgi:hypothetical protein
MRLAAPRLTNYGIVPALTGQRSPGLAATGCSRALPGWRTLYPVKDKGAAESVRSPVAPFKTSELS